MNDHHVMRGILSGKMHSFEDASMFPKVGDIVAIRPLDDICLIEEVAPRRSVLSRGFHGKSQIIATNIDIALVVMGLDQNYNLNRLDRYIQIIRNAMIEPIVVLTKMDLCDDIDEKVQKIERAYPNLRIITTTNQTADGFLPIHTVMEPHKIHCVVGSSGVGKSTLLNYLAGSDIAKTKELSVHQKGRHTTTQRTLYELPGDIYLIDTPGMKEIGFDEDVSEVHFSQIDDLAQNCRFRDCTHTKELGCAVLAAVEDGSLDSSRLKSYHKLEREALRRSRMGKS